MIKGSKIREGPKHRMAFETWFTLEKNFEKTRETLRGQDPPMRVSLATLYRWAAKYNWDERASAREAEVQRKLMEESIEAQVEFIKRKGNLGKLLQNRVLLFLNSSLDHTGKPATDKDGKPVLLVDNMAVAVTTLAFALKLEQEALGLPEWLTEVITADENTLRRVYETAVAEFVSAAKVDAAKGDDSAEGFAPVTIESVPQDRSN